MTQGFEFFGVLAFDYYGLRHRPWRQELSRIFAFPASVTGPVHLAAVLEVIFVLLSETIFLDLKIV